MNETYLIGTKLYHKLGNSGSIEIIDYQDNYYSFRIIRSKHSFFVGRIMTIHKSNIHNDFSTVDFYKARTI